MVLDAGGWPLNSARVSFAVGLGIKYDWDHNYEWHNPSQSYDNQSVFRCSKPHRIDWVANSKKSIPAHHRQREWTSEHVDASSHEVNFATDESEHPAFHSHGSHYHWHAYQEQEVGNRKVQNVHVGHSFHLCVASDHKNDQSVSNKSNNTYQSINNYCHNWFNG